MFLKGHCKTFQEGYPEIRNVTEQNTGVIETKYRNLLLRPAVFPPVEQKQDLKAHSSKLLFPSSPSHISPSSSAHAHLDSQTLHLSSPFPPAVPTQIPSLAPSWDSSSVCRSAGSKGRAGQGSSKHVKAEGALQGLCVTVKQLSLNKTRLVSGLKKRCLAQWHFC